ncbi:MAG: phosphate acyltransferase PlsX [Armatimonadota bacterium]
MVIAVDAMGGDFAPREVVAGAVVASRSVDAEITLVGDKAQIEPLLCELARPNNGPGRLTVRHSTGVVEMDVSPRAALHRDHESSMADSIEMVRQEEADAVVSAGNSGAYMALATMRLKRIGQISRPAIAIPLPTARGPSILLDAGANADCKPRHLLEFAMMGSCYAESVLERTEPTVGLLSIGEEPSKGNALTREAYSLISEAPVKFIGNVESDEVLNGSVDVVVCDGFVGNVVLKTYEAIANFLFAHLKERCQKSLLTRLGAFLMRPVFRGMHADYNYAEYGGALLLGVNGVCVVGHGRSGSKAISRAIAVAADAVDHQILERMKVSMKQLSQANSDKPVEAEMLSDA